MEMEPSVRSSHMTVPHHVGPAASLGILVLAVMGCAGPSVPVGPVGDPGGKVLAQLAAVRITIPSTALVTRITRSEPRFTTSCTTSTPGVGFGVFFVSSSPLLSIEATIAHRLDAAGWQPQIFKGPHQWYATVDGKWQMAENYVWFWQRHVPRRPTQGASLQVSTTLSGQRPME